MCGFSPKYIYDIVQLEGIMEESKQKAICEIVDTAVKSFVTGLECRYEAEIEDPNGVINSKKNNCFIAELGEEFIFYSAFVRSFDSSFGKVLENMGNSIAKLSYTVKGSIDSFLLPEQTQHIANLMNSYEQHIKPERTHYQDHNFIIPKNIDSFKKIHPTDNYFYNPQKKEHYIIELKAGGDLDNKKAKAEKIAMLEEFYLLKNLINQSGEKVYIYFATAYNKCGEGNIWKQERVRQFFAEDELLIGQNYWNFVCDDPDGFRIVFEQYRQSAGYIKASLSRIKTMYFKGLEV